MLRKDTNAGIIQEKGGCSGRRIDKFTFTTGGRGAWLRQMSGSEMRSIEAAQDTRPVPILRAENKTWWAFHAEFFWEDDGFDAKTVYALLMDRAEKEQRKLDKLRDKYRIGEDWPELEE
jgi:hypothetical protein